MLILELNYAGSLCNWQVLTTEVRKQAPASIRKKDI